MPNPTHTPGELKACPFCGGEASGPIKDPRPQFLTWYLVHCCEGDPCGSIGPARRTEAEAIAAWNQRTVDTELLEALNALDRSWLETFPDGPDGDYGLVSIGDEHKALWQQARAAITKATGHG